MKRLFIYVLLACTFGNVAIAQNASKELVSQRIVNAINKGKFYMKVSGLMKIEDEGATQSMMPTFEIAVKGGVTFTHLPDMGITTLTANGFNYMLDERSKTYTVNPINPNEPDLGDIGRLTFMKQGECNLNGVKYYYDLYRSSKGHEVTFYYNTTKVAVIDLGMESSGIGKLSLLSFDTKIPQSAIFCLGKEWKKASAGMSAMPSMSTDISKYVDEETLKSLEKELPAGFDLKKLMSGQIDDKMIEQLVGAEGLPEGMSMNDIKGAMGMGGSSNQMDETTRKQMEFMSSPEYREQMIQIQMMGGMTRSQAEHAVKQMLPDADAMMQGLEMMDEQNAREQLVQNAPEPPRCSSPWVDPSQGCELAAGGNMGMITVTDEHDVAQIVYIDQFDTPQQIEVDMALDVTDDGIWEAFNAFVEETKDMPQDEAVSYVMSYNGDLISVAEIGCVTGDMIERAVASCMLCPSALTYNNAGILFAYKNDMDNAKIYWETAEKYDSGNPTVALNLGEYYFEKGDFVTARRYVDKAIRNAPDFGLAYQVLTSINLAEGKYVDAAKTLFKSAENYFSNITASQMFSLRMAMETAKLKICEGFDYEQLFNDVFSEENKESLMRATKSGFLNPVENIPADMKSLPWLCENGKIHSTYQSLDKRDKEMTARVDSLSARNDQLAMEHPSIGAILAMGTRNTKDLLEDVDKYASELVNAHGVTEDILQMPTIPEMDLYAMASQQARGSGDGSYLLDARQYWCIYLWQFYYEDLIDRETKGWACHRGEQTFGTYPEHLTELEKRNDLAMKTGQNEWEIYAGGVWECELAEIECKKHAETKVEGLKCELECIRCKIPLGKRLVRNYYDAMWTAVLDVEKWHYETYERPLLEEYWATMTSLVGYCENTYMQEYILNEVAQKIYHKWAYSLNRGAGFGLNVEQMWAQYVQSLEIQAKETMSIISQLDMPKIPVIHKSGGELKNYGEKPKPGWRVDIPLPWGSFGLQKKNDQYSFISHNDATGTTSINNLTTGERSEYTTYESLADNPHSQDPEGYTKTIGKWAGKKVVGKMVDVVGKAAMGGASKFIPVSESKNLRQRARTIDKEGNITNSTIVYNRNYTGGVEGFNITKGRTEYRTGNTVRVERHVGYNFGFIKMTEYY